MYGPAPILPRATPADAWFTAGRRPVEPDDLRIGLKVIVRELRRGIDTTARRKWIGYSGIIESIFKLDDKSFEVGVKLGGDTISFYHDELAAEQFAQPADTPPVAQESKIQSDISKFGVLGIRALE